MSSKIGRCVLSRLVLSRLVSSQLSKLGGFLYDESFAYINKLRRD